MKRDEIKKIFDEHLNSLDCLNTTTEVAMYERLLDAAQELVKKCSIPYVSETLPTGDEIWCKASQTSRDNFAYWFDNL